MRKTKVYVVITTQKHGEDTHIFDRKPTAEEDSKMAAKLEERAKAWCGEEFEIFVEEGYMADIKEMDKFFEEDGDES